MQDYGVLFFRLWNLVWFLQSLVFLFRHEKLPTVWREYEEANRLWLNIRLLDLLSHWTQHRRSTLNRLYELFTVSRYSERRRWRSCQGQRRAAFRSSWQSTDAHAEDLRLAATQHNTSAWERYTHTHTHRPEHTMAFIISMKEAAWSASKADAFTSSRSSSSDPEQTEKREDWNSFDPLWQKDHFRSSRR